MSRKLNPDYMRRIMARDVLRGMEVVYLTGHIFNVSTRDERQPAESICIAPRREAAFCRLKTIIVVGRRKASCTAADVGLRWLASPAK